MNSSQPDGNDKDMVKWYKFNVECMMKRGLKVPAVECYKDINSTMFLDTDSKRTTVLVEEGAECCSRCKSKRVVSIDVQRRSANEGMTTIFECSECHNKWQT